MTTPEQFANIGGDLITQWAQNIEKLVAYASVFEARGGANQFNDAKHVAEQGQELTTEQVAENEELDRLAALSLDVVVHHNELVEWYKAPRRVRVAQRRADY